MNVVNLPAAPGNVGQTYMTALLQQLTQLFRRCIVVGEAQPRLTLQSPDGRSWDVTVSNAGVLSATLNTGHINPAGGHPP